MPLKRFSFSGVNTYRKCPRKFKFQYIERAPRPELISVHAYLGEAVHNILKVLHQHGADGVLLPKDKMHELYNEEWTKVKPELLQAVSPTYTIDDYIRIGREMLDTYYDRYQPFRDGTVLGLEMNLNFTLPGTEIQMIAKVDRLWKRDDGVVEICDYKTGQRLPRPKDEEFFFQMGLYQLAVMQNYPQFETIELVQYILRKDEVVRYRMTNDDLDLLQEDLRQVLATIRQANRVDDFPPQETGLCDYCEYFQLCPAKRHRQLLEQEEADDKLDSPDHPQRGAELADEVIKLHLKKKQAEAEYEEAKAKIAAYAERNDLTKIETDSGSVMVRFTNQEKFPTKSRDQRSFVELSEICRQLDLIDVFELNPRALMKEIYSRERLSEEDMKRLAEYIETSKSATVTPRVNRDDNND